MVDSAISEKETKNGRGCAEWRFRFIVDLTISANSRKRRPLVEYETFLCKRQLRTMIIFGWSKTRFVSKDVFKWLEVECILQSVCLQEIIMRAAISGWLTMTTAAFLITIRATSQFVAVSRRLFVLSPFFIPRVSSLSLLLLSLTYRQLNVVSHLYTRSQWRASIAPQHPQVTLFANAWFHNPARFPRTRAMRWINHEQT